MSSKSNPRFLRAAAALSLLLLLTGARTSVAPLPETLIGIDSGHRLGETFTVRKGDVVLRAKVFDTEVVTIDAPVTVGIAKFTDEIAPGTKLEPVLAPDRTEQLTGTSGRFYCGENQRTRSKFGELMIGDWFSKYEIEVRFCFVDTDNDKKLDKVFLAGAKDKLDQGAREITPTPYSSKMIQVDDEGGELELRVEKFKAKTNQVTFRLYLKRNGAAAPFSYILTVKDAKARHTYPDFRSDPKKVPYPAYFNDILGAGIGVMSVDAVKEQAEVKITTQIPMQLFKPVSIVYQTIYIYY
jgi:hypothetical protein